LFADRTHILPDHDAPQDPGFDVLNGGTIGGILLDCEGGEKIRMSFFLKNRWKRIDNIYKTQILNEFEKNIEAVKNRH
jgi:hypothetical protein